MDEHDLNHVAATLTAVLFASNKPTQQPALPDRFVAADVVNGFLQVRAELKARTEEDWDGVAATVV